MIASLMLSLVASTRAKLLKFDRAVHAERAGRVSRFRAVVNPLAPC